MSDPFDPRSSFLPPDGPRLAAVRAGPEHAADVQRCLEAAEDYFVATEGRPPGPDAARRLLEDAAADEDRRVYLLRPRAGGPVAGILDLQLRYPEPDTAQIGLLLLRPSCRGAGLGGEVTAATERVLAAAGYVALRAAVVDENAAATPFWERVGFAQVGTLAGGVTVFEKPLSPPD